MRTIPPYTYKLLARAAHIQVKYPIAHPHVPKPPDGYSTTPWLRCTVEFVYEGLRFLDGILPARATLEALSVAAGPGIPVGKVRAS